MNYLCKRVPSLIYDRVQNTPHGKHVNQYENVPLVIVKSYLSIFYCNYVTLEIRYFPKVNATFLVIKKFQIKGSLVTC